MRGKRPSQQVSLLWFRQSLRLSDHPALTAAIHAGRPIVPVYILDDETPGAWRLGGASRWWLAQSLKSLEKELRVMGSQLILRRGRYGEVIRSLISETNAKGLYFTRGYEPFQRTAEEQLAKLVPALGVECSCFGGHLLVEPESLRKKSGGNYRVFAPFFKALLGQISPSPPLPPPAKLESPAKWPASEALENWKLEPAKPDWAAGLRECWTVGEASARNRLRHFTGSLLEAYCNGRERPAENGTSKLSPHLAFGEISPRQVWNAVSAASAAAAPGADAAAEAYLRQLAWREFSYHLLFHFPGLPDKPLRPEFDVFPWRKDVDKLRAWQKGKAGYPIVDAGMRELWHTGWMHNRARMIVASFLTKHLLLPWQEGEAWFWDTLVDADLANNSASWQWVAGSGADAAPYFRIFNPILQGETFDPNGDYVRRFCPELAGLPAAFIHKPWQAPSEALRRAGVTLGINYPSPIIEHGEARRRALAAYRKARAAAAKAEPDSLSAQG